MIIEGVRGKKIWIFSYSKFIFHLANFHQRYFRSQENLSEQNAVVLIWVPEHSKILGNELLDELARTVRSSEFIGPEPVVGRLARLKFK